MGKLNETVAAKPEETQLKRVELLCSDCGKPIQGIKKNGVPYKTAQEIIDWSRDEFDGNACCWACAKKRLDQREAEG